MLVRLQPTLNRGGAELAHAFVLMRLAKQAAGASVLRSLALVVCHPAAMLAPATLAVKSAQKTHALPPFPGNGDIDAASSRWPSSRASCTMPSAYHLTTRT